MKVVFINGRGGRAKKRGEMARLREALRRVPDVRIETIERRVDMKALVRQALDAGAEMVGAAGGDGTINSVASGLVGTQTPLVVIPFGTLNHFARDVGAPDDMNAAAALLAEGGAPLAVDVGEVNDHIFLNNSSIGIYPYLVSQRERNEDRLGKGLAYGVAAVSLLRHPNAPRQRIRATIDGRQIEPEEKVGLVFVANNLCDIGLPRPGTRPCLNANLLDIYTLEAASRLDLLGLGVSYLTGRALESPLIAHYTAKEMTITLPITTVRVACDGEVFHTAAPLRYRSRPAALRVWLPRAVVDKAQAAV